MTAISTFNHSTKGAARLDSQSTNGIAPVAAMNEPLTVIVAGAGIGGLAAAGFLRQQGHNVTVLERSKSNNEVGAALHLAPNSNGLLRRLGIYAERFGAVEFEWMTNMTPAGEVQVKFDNRPGNRKWQHPWLLTHRVDLHSALKATATSPEGAGRPINLRLGSKVVDFDPVNASVTLESGVIVKGDVIIGADGVNSRARAQIDPNVKARSSGKNAFRFMLLRKDVLADPRTAKFAELEGNLNFWFAKDRRIVAYPCQYGKLINFVCIHPSAESEQVGKGDVWHTQATKDMLLDVFKEFDPDLLALLDKADSVKVWELWDMDQIAWTTKSLALLGDAAHPFLPYQGQGAGQAIEDAASLATVLPLGTRPEAIPERLKLYESFRAGRAHAIQEYSRVSGQDLGEDTKSKFDVIEFQHYCFGHDEWDYSSNLFRKWQWASKPHLQWRTPIAFGPIPGSGHNIDGSPRRPTSLKFSTASFKFKSSKTLLQNLFPSDSFKFELPDTVAYATYSQTTLRSLENPDGPGFRHFGLYIHGVQYLQKNGEVVSGTYLPIQFENQAQSILQGSEELGLPRIQSNLEVWRRPSTYRFSAAWGDVGFAELALEGLEQVDLNMYNGINGDDTHEGILTHKFIPRTADPTGTPKDESRADVEHAVFIPHPDLSRIVPSKVTKVFKAQKATMNFDAMDWDTLPTLHHIVSRLAEIPIYDTVAAKVVEGEGLLYDLSARRLD